MNGQYQNALHHQMAQNGAPAQGPDDSMTANVIPADPAATMMMNGMVRNIFGMGVINGIPGMDNGMNLMSGLPGGSNLPVMPNMMGTTSMTTLPPFTNTQGVQGIPPMANMQNIQQVFQNMQNIQNMRNVMVGQQLMPMMLPSMNMGMIDMNGMMAQAMGGSVVMPMQSGSSATYSSSHNGSPPEFVMNAAMKASVSTQSLTDGMKVMHAGSMQHWDCDDDDDDNDGTDLVINENTGRWTREEHHLFLKGLELYGKGWKKIAALIKTRTIVQIRTHAQKYFLKLQKARQGGDGNNPLMDRKSLFGRKKRRRRLDKAINVATHLKPFFGVPDSEDSNIDLAERDVDDGLYNFLSPTLEKITEQQQLQKQIQEQQLQASKTQDPSALSSIIKPPEWYQRGYQVDKLLQDAEELDWNADSGEAVQQPLFKRTLSMRQMARRGHYREDERYPFANDNRPISPIDESDPDIAKQMSSDGWEDTHISPESLSEFLGALCNGSSSRSIPQQHLATSLENPSSTTDNSIILNTAV